MIFLPFPPAIGEISAKSAARSNEARKGQRPGDHTTPRIAAYRLPDGRVQSAHNLYAPAYPKGSEPGLADMHSVLRHYPNDTSGYTSTCSNFMPASFVEVIFDAWDMVAIAHVARNDVSGFLMATSETELAGMVEAITPTEGQGGGSLTLDRSFTQHRAGLGGGLIPTLALLISVRGHNEIHIAADAGSMAQSLADRFAFLNLGRHADDLDASIQSIRDQGEKHGWVISYGALDPENPVLAAIVAKNRDFDVQP